MSSEIKAIVMPKWGLAMKEGSVVSWSKEIGAEIKKGENFVEIETEKVVNEYESPEDGVLIKKCVEEEVKIPVGALVALVGPKDTSTEAMDEFISNFEYTTIAKIWFLISFLSFILIPIIFFKIFKL